MAVPPFTNRPSVLTSTALLSPASEVPTVMRVGQNKKTGPSSVKLMLATSLLAGEHLRLASGSPLKVQGGFVEVREAEQLRQVVDEVNLSAWRSGRQESKGAGALLSPISPTEHTCLLSGKVPLISNGDEPHALLEDRGRGVDYLLIPLAQIQTNEESEVLVRRARRNKRKMLGLAVLATTVVSAIAALRKAVHMDVLPSSLRNAFGLPEDPSPAVTNPVVAKLTEAELARVNAIVPRVGTELDADDDRNRSQAKRSLPLVEQGGQISAVLGAIAWPGGEGLILSTDLRASNRINKTPICKEAPSSEVARPATLPWMNGSMESQTLKEAGSNTPTDEVTRSELSRLNWWHSNSQQPLNGNDLVEGLSRDPPDAGESEPLHLVKRATLPKQKGFSGSTVAKASALAAVGAFLIRAWQYPPNQMPYRRRSLSEPDSSKSVDRRVVQLVDDGTATESSLQKRTPKRWSRPAALAAIASSALAGWLLQVRGHEADPVMGRRGLERRWDESASAEIGLQGDESSVSATFARLLDPNSESEQGQINAATASGQAQRWTRWQVFITLVLVVMLALPSSAQVDHMIPALPTQGYSGIQVSSTPSHNSLHNSPHTTHILAGIEQRRVPTPHRKLSTVMQAGEEPKYLPELRGDTLSVSKEWGSKQFLTDVSERIKAHIESQQSNADVVGQKYTTSRKQLLDISSDTDPYALHSPHLTPADLRGRNSEDKRSSSVLPTSTKGIIALTIACVIAAILGWFGCRCRGYVCGDANVFPFVAQHPSHPHDLPIELHPLSPEGAYYAHYVKRALGETSQRFDEQPFLVTEGVPSLYVQQKSTLPWSWSTAGSDPSTLSRLLPPPLEPLNEWSNQVRDISKDWRSTQFQVSLDQKIREHDRAQKLMVRKDVQHAGSNNHSDKRISSRKQWRGIEPGMGDFGMDTEEDNRRRHRSSSEGERANSDSASHSTSIGSVGTESGLSRDEQKAWGLGLGAIAAVMAGLITCLRLQRRCQGKAAVSATESLPAPPLPSLPHEEAYGPHVVKRGLNEAMQQLDPSYISPFVEKPLLWTGVRKTVLESSADARHPPPSSKTAISFQSTEKWSKDLRETSKTWSSKAALFSLRQKIKDGIADKATVENRKQLHVRSAVTQRRASRRLKGAKEKSSPHFIYVDSSGDDKSEPGAWHGARALDPTVGSSEYVAAKCILYVVTLLAAVQACRFMREHPRGTNQACRSFKQLAKGILKLPYRAGKSAILYASKTPAYIRQGAAYTSSRLRYTSHRDTNAEVLPSNAVVRTQNFDYSHSDPWSLNRLSEGAYHGLSRLRPERMIGERRSERMFLHRRSLPSSLNWGEETSVPKFHHSFVPAAFQSSPALRQGEERSKTTTDHLLPLVAILLIFASVGFGLLASRKLKSSSGPPSKRRRSSPLTVLLCMLCIPSLVCMIFLVTATSTSSAMPVAPVPRGQTTSECPATGTSRLERRRLPSGRMIVETSVVAAASVGAAATGYAAYNALLGGCDQEIREE